MPLVPVWICEHSQIPERNQRNPQQEIIADQGQAGEADQCAY
jgi:hypothetical protein